MKMKYSLYSLSLALSLAYELACGQLPPASQMDTSGRIVLYDWALHEMTSSDDFIIETQISAMPFARVVYKSDWGFDAPTKSGQVLDRLAFVGRGPLWSMRIHAPVDADQVRACVFSPKGHHYDDESGSGEIPRFIATPGANTARIPDLGGLPCFILERGSLHRAATKGAR